MIHKSAGMVADLHINGPARPAGNEMEKAKMNKTIAYCKPNIVVLGSVAEMICGTHIKGHSGIIEAIHRHIHPAYRSRRVERRAPSLVRHRVLTVEAVRPCRLRNSRQRLYCSAFVGSGSSSPLSQKQNQSTLPCCEIMRSQGFSRMCVPSGI